MEHNISSAPLSPELGLEVFAAIAAEQALLFWQMLQSRPLKPEVHCPVPGQPEEVALLDSSVRFAGRCIGFPQVIVEQLLPLLKIREDGTESARIHRDRTGNLFTAHPRPVGHSHAPLTSVP